MPDARSLKVEMLRAEHGDCFFVECVDAGRTWRMLIDAGTRHSYAGNLRPRLLALADRRIDLFVVTHIDADHIGGALELLRDEALELEFGDVWFNGRAHLGTERSAQQGETLSAALTGEPGRRPMPWNLAFGRDAVATNGHGAWNAVEVAPGVELVLLSPTPEKLAALAPRWDAELARVRAGETTTEENLPLTRGVIINAPDDVITLAQEKTLKWDQTAANGSSIAFLLRFAGRTALFAADAHIDTLGPALEAYAGEGKRLHVDVFKLPHHGSERNLTTKLLDTVAADHYLVSTNGALFHHPSPRATARVIACGSPRERGSSRAGGQTIWFNYPSAETLIWNRPDLEQHFLHETRFRASDEDACSVTLTGSGR